MDRQLAIKERAKLQKKLKSKKLLEGVKYNIERRIGDLNQHYININQKKPHFMRIPKDVLKELDGCKIAKRESYADVVKRLIEKERRLRK